VHSPTLASHFFPWKPSAHKHLGFPFALRTHVAPFLHLLAFFAEHPLTFVVVSIPVVVGDVAVVVNFISQNNPTKSSTQWHLNPPEVNSSHDPLFWQGDDWQTLDSVVVIIFDVVGDVAVVVNFISQSSPINPLIHWHLNPPVVDSSHDPPF
jgi:hypothetical protein